MAKTLTRDDEVTRVSLPITKWEQDDEGNLIVWGKATDDSLDSDKQRVDIPWSQKAITEWHESGANIRVQHNPALYPAGRGISLETTADGHWVKGLVVEPTAQKLVKHKVLRAYSIGVADPVIERDPTRRAPGGVIKGGRIVEVSLVDRPANSNCYLTLAKSEGHDRAWSAGDLEALLAAAEQAGGEAPPARKADEPETGDGPDLDTADGDDVDGSGDSHGDAKETGTRAEAAAAAEPSRDDAEAVKTATAEDQAAYLAACQEWQGREPTGQAATGTEHLQAIAAWKRWADEGETEGLNGTEAGAATWLAKNAKGGPSDTDLETVAQAEAVKLAQNDPGEPADLNKREFSAEQRRQYAKEGKALSDGSYPIPDADALRRAAILARSGHGNVAGAKRLIARRAQELGVKNPLDDDGADSGKTDKPDMDKKCATCKGDGKIRGGGMKCPDCDGSGKAKPAASKSGDEPTPETAAVTDVAAATVAKAVQLGVISEDAAKEILAQLTATDGPDAAKGAPMPDGVEPAGEHREPDGTTSVERLEPDAGLPTDPDPQADHIPASVAAGGQKSGSADDGGEVAVPYAVKRMHDALCPVWTEADVLDAYPSLKSAADAVDPAWFEAQAAEKTAAGKDQKAAALTELAQAARAVKEAGPEVFADTRALLHKAFEDAYPSTKVSPQDRVTPGSYHRGYLSAGHAAEHASGSPAPAPPSSHVPEPQQFHRGNLTAGHQAASPGDHGPNNPAPPDAGGRSYYSTSEQEMTAAAMRSVHDHVAGGFAGACPMAPSRQVMPTGMGATSVPSHSPGFPQAGGYADGSRKADAPAAAASAGAAADANMPPKPKKKKGPQSMVEGKSLDQLLTEASEAGARAALKTLASASPDPAAITTLVAEQVRGLRDHIDTELSSLRKDVDKIASDPDPYASPVRGQLTRAGTPAATAVQKRNLVDEANEARRAAMAAEQADFRAYLETQARSGDPKIREKAQAVIDKMATPAAAPVLA